MISIRLLCLISLSSSLLGEVRNQEFCRKPKGVEGEVIYLDGCTKITCTKVKKRLKWLRSPSEKCCSYEGVLYPADGGEIAKLWTNNDIQVTLSCTAGPTIEVGVEDQCQPGTTPAANNTNIENKFEEILEKVFNISQKIDENGAKIEEISLKVDENGAKVVDVQTNIEDKVEAVQSNIEDKVDAVESNIGDKVDEVNQNVEDNGDKLDDLLSHVIPIILIAAGRNKNGYLRSTEEFNPWMKETSLVGDISADRHSPSFCNNFLCGGNPAVRSCEKFDGISSFKAMSVSLVEPRSSHMCWGLQSGEVLLLGGQQSPTTTEVISADGTSSKGDFTLPFEISFACGVEMGDKFVVTGGMNHSSWYNGVSTVVEFSLSGSYRHLTEMNIGRRSHACSKFVTDSGDIALMVVGGAPSHDATEVPQLTSVEIMVKSTWYKKEPLPSPRYYLAAATLDNSVSVFGGAFHDEGYIYHDEIFTYTYSGLTQNGTWNMTGTMSEKRAFHIVTKVDC